MKKSLNAWTVEDSLGFEDMFRQVKEAGFDGIELNIDKDGHSAHSLTLGATDAELASIRRLSGSYDLPVVSISTSLYGNRMGSPDDAERAFACDVLKKQLDCAQALGAGGILTVPGGVLLQNSYEKAYDACLDTLEGLRPAIEAARMSVGVENVWNGFFLSPFDMAGFIDKLGCPYIGAYFDVGNVAAFSWPEYWIDILGKRIGHIHIKDFKRQRGINSGGAFCDLTKGDVNWPAVTAALKKAGFDGYLTAEVFIAESSVAGIGYDDYIKGVSAAAGKIINS